jgi:hypothetical protein
MLSKHIVMRLNSLKPQLKPKALEGGLSEFYTNLKEKYNGDDLTYVKGTPCVLGCMSIIRKLIKVLSLQAAALSSSKPKLFASIPLNRAVLEPIVSKEGLDWNIKVKNVKTDMNATQTVSLYNINRKLSHLVAYDLNIDEKVLDNYINYVNREIEFLDNIINKLGGEKSNGVLSLDDRPSDYIINENNKRREQVKKVFKNNMNNEPNLPD